MNLIKTTGVLGLATLAAITSPWAVADDSGWYAGASAGRSTATIDDAKITSSLLSGGLTTTSIIDRERSNGFKIFGGYQLNKNFALEGGYFDLGKFGFTANTNPAGTFEGETKINGLNLDLVGTVPITEKFSAFGRAGLAYANASDSFSGTGAVQVSNPNPSKRAMNYKVGLGLQYAFTDSLGMRAEVERYRVNDAVGNKGDIDLFSVGLIYRFGGKTEIPVQRATVVEYVAPAPAPVLAPAPVIVPPPPLAAAPMRVTFSADSLFDFDKSVVKPSGKQDLDKLAADLNGVSYDAIQVTGHTDRIGAHAYNLKLSTRRAEAVSAYLVQSAGIPASKISARGVNGSEPVTQPGECKGSKASPKLIACLQPDRRVDVEVTGLK